MKHFNLLVFIIVFFVTNQCFSQISSWYQQTNPVTGRDLNSAWAVDANTCWMCGATSSNTLGYVIRTTTSGQPWTNVTGNMPVSTVGLYSICGISATEAWVGASDGSVYHTTNGGSTWSFVTLPSPVTAFIDNIHFFNAQTGFIIGDPVISQWCYYWTTNAGANWTFGPAPSFTGSEAGYNNAYCALDTGHIWFCSNNGKIYHGGFRSNFTSAATVGTNSLGVAFVNANTGVAIMSNSTTITNENFTTNGGITWTAGYTPAGIQYAIMRMPGYSSLWSCGAGATGGVILYSNNNGYNWTTSYTMNETGYCITFGSSNTAWVGCSTGLIYKSMGPDEVNNNNTTLPTNYSLEQNYPNPFNPSTKIEFSLPNVSYVTLKVYDILGKEVSTLLDGVIKTPGVYSISFDGTNLSSGVYYYKLISENFISTRRMMLMK